MMKRGLEEHIDSSSKRLKKNQISSDLENLKELESLLGLDSAWGDLGQNASLANKILNLSELADLPSTRGSEPVLNKELVSKELSSLGVRIGGLVSNISKLLGKPPIMLKDLLVNQAVDDVNQQFIEIGLWQSVVRLNNMLSNRVDGFLKKQKKSTSDKDGTTTNAESSSLTTSQYLSITKMSFEDELNELRKLEEFNKDKVQLLVDCLENGGCRDSQQQQQQQQQHKSSRLGSLFKSELEQKLMVQFLCGNLTTEQEDGDGDNMEDGDGEDSEDEDDDDDMQINIEDDDDNNNNDDDDGVVLKTNSSQKKVSSVSSEEDDVDEDDD
eukprot:TRINITY_DN251_c2_g1_i1.p2 TRINITY_DN251_c2_g1~~TRINITY_DN251_c2_g1_i1.p2  ORF type:complete len:327 (+),score=129.86 TRINITY_DN251_c2_g1_i1:1364-2344(+)